MVTIDQIEKMSEHKEELKQNYHVKDIGIFWFLRDRGARIARLTMIYLL
jgi:predicted nucleotidyltransferase